MTTDFAEPEPEGMQTAGEVCNSCRAFWAYQDLPPMRLVLISEVTENRGIPIVVCPHCDGGILRLRN